MTPPEPSNVRTLRPEQVEALVAMHADLARTSPSQAEGPGEVLRRMAEIIGTRLALLRKEDDGWTVAAEAGAGIAIPTLDATTIEVLERAGNQTTIVLDTMHRNNADWTVLGLSRRSGVPLVLLLHENWTRSRPTLLQIADTLITAERTSMLSGSAQARLATHRLSRALARVTGFKKVALLGARNAARAVRAELATVAVADADNQSLQIMATHGYPFALVEHLSIPRGVGVLGSVYDRANRCACAM